MHRTNYHSNLWFLFPLFIIMVSCGAEKDPVSEDAIQFVDHLISKIQKKQKLEYSVEFLDIEINQEISEQEARERLAFILHQAGIADSGIENFRDEYEWLRGDPRRYKVQKRLFDVQRIKRTQITK